MPVYEYFCTGCNRKFELLRSLRQVEDATCCPRCQQVAERKFSTFASFSKDNSGLTSAIGGSSCSSCASTSCSTCNAG